MNLSKSAPNPTDNPSEPIAATEATENPLVASLSKFDQQLERIATTLNLFESQLQNVDRQIKDLETLAANQTQKVAENVAVDKSAKKQVNLKKGVALDRDPVPVAVVEEVPEKKKGFLGWFNEKISGIQDVQDLILTTAKNLYFVAIPIAMMLTMMYPAQTKNALTGIENFKGKIGGVIESDASVKDKYHSINDIVKETLFESDEDRRKREKEKAVAHKKAVPPVTHKVDEKAKVVNPAVVEKNKTEKPKK